MLSRNFRLQSVGDLKWLKEHYPKSTLYEQDKWQPGAFSSYREDLFYYLDEVL